MDVGTPNSTDGSFANESTLALSDDGAYGAGGDNGDEGENRKPWWIDDMSAEIGVLAALECKANKSLEEKPVGVFNSVIVKAFRRLGNFAPSAILVVISAFSSFS